MQGINNTSAPINDAHFVTSAEQNERAAVTWILLDIAALCRTGRDSRFSSYCAIIGLHRATL